MPVIQVTSKDTKINLTDPEQGRTWSLETPHEDYACVLARILDGSDNAIGWEDGNPVGSGWVEVPKTN